MIHAGVAFKQRIEFMLGLPLDFFQQLIRREDLALVQGLEHPLPIGEQQGVSDVEEKRFGWHSVQVYKVSEQWLVISG